MNLTTMATPFRNFKGVTISRSAVGTLKQKNVDLRGIFFRNIPTFEEISSFLYFHDHFHQTFILYFPKTRKTTVHPWSKNLWNRASNVFAQISDCTLVARGSFALRWEVSGRTLGTNCV